MVLAPARPALATDATLLYPAGRRLDAAEIPAIDPDRAGLDPLRQPQGPPDVAGIDAGDQAVGEAVGDGQRLVLAIEVDRRADRAEDLLAGDPRARRHLVEQSRLDKIAAVEMGRPAAAEAQPRPARQPVGDIAHDLAVLFLRDDWPEIVILHPRPDGEAGRLFLQPLDELVADRALQQEARRGGADLAAIAEQAVGGVDGGALDVGIG